MNIKTMNQDDIIESAGDSGDSPFEARWLHCKNADGGSDTYFALPDKARRQVAAVLARTASISPYNVALRTATPWHETGREVVEMKVPGRQPSMEERTYDHRAQLLKNFWDESKKSPDGPFIVISCFVPKETDTGLLPKRVDVAGWGRKPFKANLDYVLV
ncbi:MAG: hypothetical protein AB7G06_07280 [Bdellovibrionales bacterium]